MTQAQVREVPRAQALVDELNRRWRGQEACDEGPVIIDDIELAAPASVWPPRLRITFTLGGRPGVWEDEFDIGFPIDNGPVWSAADWFARIAWTTFLEMQDTRSRPRGLRMLDGRPIRAHI
jgi:hypothetical protein